MKPGLYVATVWGCETSVVLGPFEEAFPWRRVVPGTNLCGALKGEEVTDPRPLVVLDPESDEDMNVLCEALVGFDPPGNLLQESVRRALRAVANPKPVEPTGLGAVVREQGGLIWLRNQDSKGCPWWSKALGRVAMWNDIDAAEVLSEGWSE